MKRRVFLSAGLVVASGFYPFQLLAQNAANRAAVIIGVDKSGDLPRLSAASSGARQFAAWLSAEGFDVRLIEDSHSPVTAHDVFEAINLFVQRGNVDQLVVYFSGHGFLVGQTEMWMFSDAPGNPNEGASLFESVEYAKDSGIPNVVFISDACRSRSNDAVISRVRGQVVFPSSGSATFRSKIDKFYAARPGNPAFELPIAESAGRFEGIYTSVFMQAFKKPDPTMVKVLPDGIKVVPNRMLSDYLVREVEKRVQAVAIGKNQTPDAEVLSDDTAYIARIAPDSALLLPAGTEDTGDITTSSTTAISRESIAPAELSQATVQFVAKGEEFVESKMQVLAAVTVPSQILAEIASGFVISGRDVASVHVNPRNTVKISKSNGATIVSVDFDRDPGCSVAVRFADGTGTVLGAIREFVGTVTVANGGVNNVSYDPARENWRFAEYEHSKKRLADLRSTVAALALNGVFRIEGSGDEKDKSAESIANKIRMMKGYDPTLGIYAAYAYDEAELEDKANSVFSFMRDDLNVPIFDVAVLARKKLKWSQDDPDYPVPCCPMLTQGWNYLRVRGVNHPRAVDAAHDHLLPALWTTFDREGVDILVAALESGEIR